MASFMPRRLAAVLAAMSLSACGPAPLGGSLKEMLDLSYDSAELRWTTDELAVAFVRDGGDVVLQVTAALVNLDTVPNVPINLAEKLTATQQRGTLSRSVRNDTTTSFPPLERGTLRVDGTPVTGARVSGSFNATFVQGTSGAFGRTVNGSFDALVRQTP